MASYSTGTGEGSSQELLHVLAVDDSLVDRKVITGLLRKSKYRGIYIYFLLLWYIPCFIIIWLFVCSFMVSPGVLCILIFEKNKKRKLDSWRFKYISYIIFFDSKPIFSFKFWMYSNSCWQWQESFGITGLSMHFKLTLLLIFLI